MVTQKARIISLLTERPGLTDREITHDLQGIGAPQQAVNQACRQLERDGLLRRDPEKHGAGRTLIRNRLGDETASTGVPTAAPIPTLSAPPPEDPRFHEDYVKEASRQYLAARGWEPIEVAWGRSHGVDLTASRGQQALHVEAKGLAPSQQQKTNYFINALGELLQHMQDANSFHALALPDDPVYRGLWDRLPEPARAALKLSVFLIGTSGNIEVRGYNPDDASH